MGLVHFGLIRKKRKSWKILEKIENLEKSWKKLYFSFFIFWGDFVKKQQKFFDIRRAHFLTKTTKNVDPRAETYSDVDFSVFHFSRSRKIKNEKSSSGIYQRKKRDIP